MPMKTTLLTGQRLSSPSPSSRLANNTWPIISAAVRLRLKPCCAVAQKAQSRAQPAWEEMHSVARRLSGINTVSTAWA